MKLPGDKDILETVEEIPQNIKSDWQKLQKIIRENRFKILFASLVFVGFIALLTFLANYIGQDRIDSFVATAGIWGPLVSFVSITALTVFSPFSVSTLILTSILLFGDVIGFGVSILGLTCGGIINFWIARSLGRKVVTRLVGEDGVELIDKYLKLDFKFSSIVYIPILIFVTDILSYGLGLGKMKFRDFLVVILVLNFIVVIFNVYVTTDIIRFFLYN